MHIREGSDAPSSPNRISPKQHSRDASKSFFSNLMASKSSHKLQAQAQAPPQSQLQCHSPVSSIADPTDRPHGRSRGNSKDRALHSIKKQTSTPDLPRLMTARQEEANEMVPPSSADGPMSKQKSKSKLGGILTRSRSGRPEDDKKHKTKPPGQLSLDVHQTPDTQSDQYAVPLKTAPLKPTYREQLQAEGSIQRNHSADRMGHEDTRTNGHSLPSNANSSHSLLANIQQTGRGVGDRLGKAGRGWFSKMTRSGSTNERELIPDEHYVCTTISLPLVKQTRKTRIAKRLENSKDKTEYWLPALPWRCIDYLNMQCEQEGLYRVPGSGREVKFWQRRFDTEYDINLFDEPELYDVNTIASMFKAWLRDLPDELFPKEVQAKIAKECAGAQRTPKMLKDELSMLPPFNYYLLFAITCHLSLLHSYSEQNKMDYRNLCICFQPCLRIDAFCFQFLVIDWKECWQQGCWTEKEYLIEELRHEKEGSMDEIDEKNAVIDERAVSSSNGSSNGNGNAHGHGHGMNGSTVRNAEHGRSRTPQQQHQQQGQNDQRQISQAQPKQRSLSSSGGRERTRTPSHGHAHTAPAVPRLATQAKEHAPARETQKLPELGSMSPINIG